MKYLISPSKLVFFIIMSSIFTITSLYFPILLDEFGNTSWIAVIIAIFIISITFLLFPNFSENYNPLKEINDKKLVKLVFSFYLIITLSLIVITCSVFIKTIFYQKTPIFIIVLILTSIISILSHQSIKCIIDTGVVFFFICIIIYILPLTSTTSRNLILILPLEIDLSKIHLILLMLVFPLDIAIYVIYNPIIKGGIKKKHLIIASVLLLCYFLFIVLDSITLLGSEFLKDIPFGGFLRWEFLEDNRFFQSFDILLLLLATIITIYKSAINIHLFKLINNIKRKVVHIPIIFGILTIITIIGITLFSVIENNILIILILILILSVIIYIYFNYIGRKYANEK